MYLRRLKRVLCLAATVLSCAFALPAAAQSVLVLGSPNDPVWNAEVRTTLLATGAFTTVDEMNIATMTPSLATLQTYDAVLVYSDGAGFQNPSALGDNLHDYLIAGGGVVDAVFTTAGINMSGRFVSLGDSAFAPTGGSGGAATLGAVALPAHPLMSGVTTFDGGLSAYRGDGTVAAGADLIASWSTGEPLIMTKAVGAGQVVTLNFFPPSDANPGRADFWDDATDGDLIMRNALLYAANPVVPPPTIPTMGEWAMILFALMLAGGAAVMVQRRRLTA